MTAARSKTRHHENVEAGLTVAVTGGVASADSLMDSLPHDSLLLEHTPVSVLGAIRMPGLRALTTVLYRTSGSKLLIFDGWFSDSGSRWKNISLT